MKKRISTVPSIYLLIAWVTVTLFLLSIFINCLFYMIILRKIDFCASFMCIAALLCLSFILSSKDGRQWVRQIVITNNNIVIHTIFEKPHVLSYTEYNKLYYGYMVVSGTYEWFIVISNRTMSRYELSNLNKIKHTDDFIKIKYSKKRREQLCEILPENMACQLKNPPQGKK